MHLSVPSMDYGVRDVNCYSVTQAQYMLSLSSNQQHTFSTARVVLSNVTIKYFTKEFSALECTWCLHTNWPLCQMAILDASLFALENQFVLPGFLQTIT